MLTSCHTSTTKTFRARETFPCFPLLSNYRIENRVDEYSERLRQSALEALKQVRKEKHAQASDHNGTNGAENVPRFFLEEKRQDKTISFFRAAIPIV